MSNGVKEKGVTPLFGEFFLLPGKFPYTNKYDNDQIDETHTNEGDRFLVNFPHQF